MAEGQDRAKTFVAGVCAVGIACVIAGTIPWQNNDVLQFLCYVALTAIASALKVVLPGLEGTVSVSFIFVLVGVCNMSLSETLALGLTAAIVQCYWRSSRKLRFVQFLFNIAQIAIAITASHRLYNWLVAGWLHRRAPLALLLATLAYFVLNTMPVAAAVALTEQQPIWKKWSERYSWTFPYYLVGAAIAGAIQVFNRIAGWEISILLMPAIYAVYRSYRVYIGKLEFEKQHLEEMASVHMRTIETLALAIEAKDQNTHDHLQRVNVYAMELARDLRLSTDETEALRAAAVLHDIGKLAVPEHIISKPGRLTPEEFDKMKIHPIVGAEILEQVRFPYPVAPIVRSHHEKWDGTGYPDGLSGDAIPIGARILSAVDCLDALASDRQYRRALPLDEAMAEVEREAGKSFDPSVVAALKARYIELEQMTHEQQPEERPKLSTDVKVERGAAPAAGFAQTEPVAPAADAEGRKASQGSRARRLAGITADLASAHNLEEALALFSVRLRLTIAFDTIAFYGISDDVLTPQFVSGEQRRALLALRIPRGEGLSGWVAETHKCIMNGNPAVEPGFEQEPGKLPALRSALAVPLETEDGMLGVITLYHSQPDAFTSDHLRIMQAISVQLASTVEQWIGPQQREKQTAPEKNGDSNGQKNGKKPPKSHPRNPQPNGAPASRDTQSNGSASRASQPNGSAGDRRRAQLPKLLVFNPKLAK